MITITFTIVFLSILSLISTIDMFLLQEPFLIAFIKLFAFDKGTNEGFINTVAVIGLIYSAVMDFRIRKNKGSNGS